MLDHTIDSQKGTTTAHAESHGRSGESNTNQPQTTVSGIGAIEIERPHCLTCGYELTDRETDIARVIGDNDDNVPVCPHCWSGRQQKQVQNSLCGCVQTYRRRQAAGRRVDEDPEPEEPEVITRNADQWLSYQRMVTVTIGFITTLVFVNLLVPGGL